MYLAISGILLAITSFCVSIFIFLKAPKNITSITWTFFSLTVGLWGFGLFKAFTTDIETNALFWSRFLNLVAIFIPIFFFHFIISFTNLTAKKKKELISFYIVMVIYFFLSLFSKKNFIASVRHILTFKYYPTPGKLYYLLPVFFSYLVIYGIVLLIHELKNANLCKKNQIKHLFIGVTIGFLGGSMTFLPVFGIKIHPIGIYLTPIYILTVTYAILKHKLLDINIALRKISIYSLIISLLFIISVTILFLINFSFGKFFPEQTIWSTFFTIVTLSLFFQPLYRWANSQIDKLFFKGTLPKIAEDLEKSEKLAALGVLASGLAHEIKNPLAPIKTYIQNLPNNANDPKYIEKLTKVIPSEIDKITNIINQLRDFANPSPLSISRINLHNLIDKKFNLLEQDFISRKIEVIKEYSSELSQINADLIQLEKVFLNLFLNAIDAMPNGGKLSITTKIDSNNSALIKVSDTGIGIAKEDLSHIFDPFYSKGKHKGMGLGLAVVYQIIKEHGGSVQVATIQWRGTTFTVSIPINKNI